MDDCCCCSWRFQPVGKPILGVAKPRNAAVVIIMSLPSWLLDDDDDNDDDAIMCGSLFSSGMADADAGDDSMRAVVAMTANAPECVMADGRSFMVTVVH